MYNFTFKPNYEIVRKIPGIYPVDQIKNEVMLFNCSFDFTRKNCGPITTNILRNVDWTKLGPIDKITVNTRVTMTMNGYYPSIPGWHCDNVPRSEKYSQPDLTLVDPAVQNVLCFVSSVENHSETEFLDQEIEIGVNKNDVWSSVDEYLNSYDHALNLKTEFIEPGQIVQFDQQALHRSTHTINPGWRLFLRVSNADIKQENEIRNQVQIYLPLGKGW